MQLLRQGGIQVGSHMAVNPTSTIACHLALLVDLVVRRPALIVEQCTRLLIWGRVPSVTQERNVREGVANSPFIPWTWARSATVVQSAVTGVSWRGPAGRWLVNPRRRVTLQGVTVIGLCVCPSLRNRIGIIYYCILCDIVTTPASCIKYPYDVMHTLSFYTRLLIKWIHKSATMLI